MNGAYRRRRRTCRRPRRRGAPLQAAAGSSCQAGSWRCARWRQRCARPSLVLPLTPSRGALVLCRHVARTSSKVARDVGMHASAPLSRATVGYARISVSRQSSNMAGMTISESRFTKSAIRRALALAAEGAVRGALVERLCLFASRAEPCAVERRTISRDVSSGHIDRHFKSRHHPSPSPLSGGLCAAHCSWPPEILRPSHVQARSSLRDV
jgi:hypothetical protein